MTIKEIRLITGLSQAKFAEKYGMPTRYIERWESKTDPIEPPNYVIALLERVVREDYEKKDSE